MATLRRLLRMVGVVLAVFGTAIEGAIGMRWRPPSNPPARRARIQQIACRRVCRLLGLTVRVQGNWPDAGRGISVSNHLGVLDAWLIGRDFPVSFAAKAEMSTWFGLGWASRIAGVVFVERDRKMSTTQFVAAIRDRMAAGVRIHVFPEGTTSDGVALLPFKTGGFAASAEVPESYVLPIRIGVERVGVRLATVEDQRSVAWHPGESMFAHSWRVLGLPPMEFSLAIGEPIPAMGRNRKELARLAREAVERLGANEEISLPKHSKEPERPLPRNAPS